MNNDSMLFQQDVAKERNTLTTPKLTEGEQEAGPEGTSDRLFPERIVGEFSLQLNERRAHRPGVDAPRPGRQPISSADVIACLFGCQNPSIRLSLLLRTFVVWLRLTHSHWVAFENAAAIMKNHLLWVKSHQVGPLTVYPHSPQILSSNSVEDFLALVRASIKAVIFSNPLGGGGTVNHLHFQSIEHVYRLAIEDARRVRIGNYTLLANYPAGGLVFDADGKSDRLWDCVNAFQSKAVPVNLVSVGHSVYVFPRNAEHAIVEEFPGGALASLELAGKFITADEQFFERANVDLLRAALKKTTFDTDAIVAVLNGGSPR